MARIISAIFFIWLVSAAPVVLAGRPATGPDPDREEEILRAVGQALVQRHYSPRAVDDSFSVVVWRQYLSVLDPEKRFLLAEDIDKLEGYSTMLDDELLGKAPMGFLPYAVTLYARRLDSAEDLYHRILSHPYYLNAKEGALTGNATFFKTAAEQEVYVRKYLKYRVLQQFVVLLSARTDSKKGDSLYGRTDADLEKIARERVGRQADREIARLKAGLSEGRSFDVYLNVIVHCMDPHTDYFSPVENQTFVDALRNKMSGIGCELKDDNGAIRIVGVEPGGPAWKSGSVKENDIIQAVGEGAGGEMMDFSRVSVGEAVGLIRGPKGSVVRLELKRPDGSVGRIMLVRDEIVLQDGFARAAVITQDGRRTGYIVLPKFYADPAHPEGANCARDVAALLVQLKAEKVDNIVMDLRSNGGGSLQEVVKMVGLFIPAGPVVQVRDRQKTIALEDKDSSLCYDGSLVVLVNEFSASASEIFAAAIQDYHRGLIAGSSSTYGKGTVQSTLGLGNPDEGGIKLTIAKFYRISGGSTQLRGVTPDIVLPDMSEDLHLRERDNPFALPWDEVAGARYVPWAAAPDIARLQQLEKERLRRDTAFDGIRQLSTLVGEPSYKEKILDRPGYEEQAAEHRRIIARFQRLQKLPGGQELSVGALAVSSGIPVRDDKWLESVKTDIYVREAIFLAQKIKSKGDRQAD